MDYGFDTDFGPLRYDWEPDYLKDQNLMLERFNPAPARRQVGSANFTPKAIGAMGTAAGGAGLLGLLGAAAPVIGPALGVIGMISSLLEGNKKQKAEEERRRKMEALQRAQTMSSSFEGAGGKWGY